MLARVHETPNSAGHGECESQKRVKIWGILSCLLAMAGCFPSSADSTSLAAELQQSEWKNVRLYYCVGQVPHAEMLEDCIRGTEKH